MIKKVSALVLALTMCLTTLTACGGKDSDSSSKADSSSAAETSSGAENGTAQTAAEPSLTIDGKKIDTDNFVVCTVDGRDVDFTTFRYYYYYTISRYTQTYGATLDTIASTDGGFELLMQDVITAIKQEFVTPQLADENKITLTDEDKTSVDEQVASAKAGCESEEDYQTQLKNAYLTEDLYKQMLESAALYTKVKDTLFSNNGKYATSEDDFKKIVQDTDKYCREVHVMIPFYSQVELDSSTADSYDSMSLSEKASAKNSAYAQLDDAGVQKAKEAAKKLADEVLKKAQDGDDFTKLIEEYGWDTGLEDSTDGYYFDKETTGFPEKLVTDAFALKEDGVSTALTEDDTYGYFIIKRLPVDMDYVTENLETMISTYDAPAISQLYQDRMDAMEVTYCDGWDKITADSIS